MKSRWLFVFILVLLFRIGNCQSINLDSPTHTIETYYQGLMHTDSGAVSLAKGGVELRDYFRSPLPETYHITMIDTFETTGKGTFYYGDQGEVEVLVDVTYPRNAKPPATMLYILKKQRDQWVIDKEWVILDENAILDSLDAKRQD